MNGKQVRLKDIQDKLLGTGLGVRAYSVIEQGRIDQVLSTKPQDRRRLIEEASGITRYKLKKRLAESKLEETRGNLLRISDIVSEIERNVASLKRQASRAARYREQSDALRGKKAALARTRHDVLLGAVGEAERTRNARRDVEAAAAAALGRAEAELASARVAAADLQAERDRLREAVSSLENAIQRDDALLEGNRRAAADLADRRASLEREGRDVTAEQARSASELAELEERLERAIVEARARLGAREPTGPPRPPPLSPRSSATSTWPGKRRSSPRGTASPRATRATRSISKPRGPRPRSPGSKRRTRARSRSSRRGNGTSKRRLKRSAA